MMTAVEAPARHTEWVPPPLHGTRFSSLPFRSLLVLGVHVPLGIVMQQFPTVSTIHAALTFVVAVAIAITSRVERIVYAAAYICGAEVLWRMTHSRSPWEFGKYGVLVIFGIALLRQRRFRLHWPAGVFLLLLTPSVAYTMIGLDAEQARQQIAFNLTGPVSLAICVWLLSTVDLGPKEMRRVVLALIAPLVSIVTITAMVTYVIGGVQFGTESNFASSGGFGPNQVSAILGFGALSAFLASFDRNAGLSFRLIMLGMTLALVIQSAMTFSRGGLLVAGLSTATALWYLIRDRRARMRLLMAVIALSVAGVYVIVPTLDSFTGGALSKRFGNHELTGREDVVRDDLDVWIANPVLGVGPGMAKFHRVRTNHGGRPMAAHTEFSRLLAEHGLLGLSAMGVLLLMCIHAVRRATSPHTRAFAIAYVSWSMLFMFQSGTRIVAPSLSMGLAHALGRGGRRRASDEDDVPEWMETALLIQASVSARAQRVARVPRAGLASGAAIEGPR